MAMFFKLIIFIFILISTESIESSHVTLNCLQITSAAHCSKIQQAGTEIKTQILLIDELLRETVSRSLDEGASIMNSTLASIKDKIKPMKLNPSNFAIDGAHVQQVQKRTALAITNQIITANHKMHDAIVTMSMTFSGGHDVTAQYIFSSKGIDGLATFDATISKLGTSIDGVTEAVMPHIQSAVVTMSQEIFTAFSSLYGIFADSLKVLFAGSTISVNFDQMRSDIDNLLKQAAMSCALSIAPRLSDALKAAAIHIDDINTMTTKLHKDKRMLKVVIEPATSLVSEALDECESSADHSVLIQRSMRYANDLNSYYQDIRVIVSQ